MKIGVMIHDLVEENGKTIKENNMEKTHNIPLWSLIEVKDTGERLYVGLCDRDCDGTPLYWLCRHDDIGRDFHISANRRHHHCDGGYSEDSITLIKEPEPGYFVYGITFNDNDHEYDEEDVGLKTLNEIKKWCTEWANIAEKLNPGTESKTKELPTNSKYQRYLTRFISFRIGRIK